MPQPRDIHRQFISDFLRFDRASSTRCYEIKRVYEDWLLSEYGRSSNSVDRNFLYEEIEVMGNGIAWWRTKPNHHFEGVRFKTCEQKN